MPDGRLNIAKIKAFDDIKKMIRFLQEEQADLNKGANKREFFRKNIEAIYELNFKNKIPIEEYESIIFDVCIAKTIMMGENDEKKLLRKIDDAVLQYNILNKGLLAEKFSMAGADDSRRRTLIRATVEKRYKEIVSPLISEIIRTLLPNKEIDSREIISIVKNKRFEIDTVSISKIFSYELKDYQRKHPTQFQRDVEIKRRIGKRPAVKKENQESKTKTIEQKMDMIVHKEKKRKMDFINSLSDIEFTLGETFLDNITRVFVHQAVYKQKRLSVISYALEGEIDNVSLVFENLGNKQQGGEFFFDLGELQVYNKEVLSNFIKNKLGLFSKMLGVQRILEATWFLLSVLSAKRKLPLKTVEFIKNTFLIYVEEISGDILQKTIQQEMQK
jgi:hypothetical protein